jgi:cadmium resistance protein CadD (predicted permease)
MESLALVAGLVVLAVTLSGPFAYLFLYSGYPYIGGTLGMVAAMLGIWWALVMRGQVAWFGLASAAVGLWVALQAWRRHSAD